MSVSLATSAIPVSHARRCGVTIYLMIATLTFLAAPASSVAVAQESIVWGDPSGPWASGPASVSNGMPPETMHDITNTFILSGTTTPRRLSITFTGTGSAFQPPEFTLPWAGTALVSVGGVAFLDDGTGETPIWSHSETFGPPIADESIGGSIGPMTAHFVVQPGVTYTLRVMNTGLLNFYDIGYFSTNLTSEVSFAVLHVDADAAGSNDGTDWTNAFNDLQDALAIAIEGDNTWVACGTYIPTNLGDETAVFDVPSGVTIYGGFIGDESSLTDRQPGTCETILSGNLGDWGGITRRSKHVVNVSGGGAGVTLDGLVISDSWNQDGSIALPAGGAIVLDGSDLLIRDVIVRDNHAGGGGGVGVFGASSLDLLRVHFEGNTADLYGGAIYGPVNLCEQSVFRANGETNLAGGAVAGSIAICRDTLFESNFSLGDGGALAGSGYFENVWFQGNSTPSGGAGGAVNGSATYVNVLFTGNGSGRGGAVFGNGTFINCTLYGNGAIDSGGGIYGDPTIISSILWNNEAREPEFLPWDEIYGTASISHSLVRGCGGSGPDWLPDYGVDLGGNIQLDPVFVDPAAGNLRLALASPAINAGASGQVPPGVGIDLDGNPRVVGPSVDMGAYEFPGFEVLAVQDVPNDQGRQVRLTWSPVADDARGIGSDLAGYNVFRRIDAVFRTDKQPDLMTPEGSWDFIGSVPASGETEYNYIAPTLCDSTGVPICWSTFFVRAVTTDPFIFYDSPITSGYSVDNLAPSAPSGLQVLYVWGDSETETGARLVWLESDAEDFRYFKIYRGNTSEFTVGSETLQHTTTDTTWLDTDARVGSDLAPSHYYRITAVDFAGNESEIAVPEPITGVAPPTTSRFALGSARPNPFNPSTTISYSLGTAGDAQLIVYDLAGRRVKTLVSGHVDVGQHEAHWDGRDEQGRRVASGVYLYRLVAGDFSETKRMVLLK